MKRGGEVKGPGWMGGWGGGSGRRGVGWGEGDAGFGRGDRILETGVGSQAGVEKGGVEGVVVSVGVMSTE